MKVTSLADAKREARAADRRPPDGPDGNAIDRAGPCPVEPLGMRDGTYFFFNTKGERRALSTQHMGQMPQLLGLFGGDKSWPLAVFPQLDKEGNPTGWFSARALCAWLMERCAALPLFSGEEPVRDIGVWRTPAGVALHLGAEIRLGGERRPAGFRAWGALWPALPPAPAPADTPASAEQAAALEQAFARWNWLQPEAPALFFGIWSAGLLGAAIRWRPHCLVVGGPGTGKSTLMECYAAASPLARMQNDYTEAGLRQTLNGRAGPAILDEAEGDADGATKLKRVIELLRRSSGGAGLQGVRGSPGGLAQQFQVVVSAVLGGILPPALEPQDATRITRIDLRPRAPDGRALPAEAELVALRALAPGLWARALAGIDRMEAMLDRLRVEFIARGCTPRLADQMGTILAARAMMLSDTDLAAGEEEELFQQFRAYLPAGVEQDAEGGPATCLMHLLQSPSTVHRQGEQPTLGALVYRARNNDVDGQDADAILQAHGLRRVLPPRHPPGPPWLLVADAHPQLERVFGNTRWAGRRWREDLRRLDGAIQHNLNVQRKKVRCTLIPPQHLPGMEPDDAE